MDATVGRRCPKGAASAPAATAQNGRKTVAIAIERELTDLVKKQLGTVYDELLQVMIDLASSPIGAFSDDRHRLVEVRTKAWRIVSEWTATFPEKAEELHDMVPRAWRVPDVAQALIEASLLDDYFLIPKSAFAPVTADDRVLVSAPELLEHIDDDGLLEVRGFDAHPHGVLHQDLALHYHQFLWRGFVNTVHYGLISMILQLARSGDVEARLAIDGHRLRFSNEYEKRIELDYWFGPPLDHVSLDDIGCIGETVHGSSNPSASPLASEYIASSFRWKRDGGCLKSVEIEELVSTSDDASELVLARYSHAIRDTNEHTFTHFDGAVKGYSVSGYPQTIEEFKARSKSRYYRKVFRLDGRIAVGTWSDIVAQWFRGNELILEQLASLADD